MAFAGISFKNLYAALCGRGKTTSKVINSKQLRRLDYLEGPSWVAVIESQAHPDDFNFVGSRVFGDLKRPCNPKPKP